MLRVDRERTTTINMNLVVLIAGLLAILLAVLVIDFAEKAILGILLLMVILIVVIGTITIIAYQAEQRRQRLKVMAQYGQMAQELANRARLANLKPIGLRQLTILAELSEIFAIIYGRLTGERCWVSIRQVYTDGSELFIHDVLHPSNFDTSAGASPELNDLEASPAFKAIWKRVRQANHPYYVCANIERDWKNKAASLGRNAEEAKWPGFYRSLIAYFGKQYIFSYHSMAVIPIGGGAPTITTEEDQPKIMPWGYIAVLSESSGTFSDAAVRDLGRRCAAVIEELVSPQVGQETSERENAP